MAWAETVSRHRHYTPPRADAPPELFGSQEPPSVAIDTSEAAALEIQTKAGSIRGSVLSFIRGRGPRGATLREIAHALRLSENTARPRCWELEGCVPAGRLPRPALIYKSDEKRDGMRVYKAVHHG